MTAAGPQEDPSRKRVGVLLLNLGSPASPSTRNVRRYLREFLGDPRVLAMHPILRALLLHCVILPFRPWRSAAAYRKIWTEEGSPLLVESRSLRSGVATRLDAGFDVALAMRYGTPSIQSALDLLLAEKPAQLVVVPLFPQYAEAATGSCLARVNELLDAAGVENPPTIHCVPAFYDEPGYIAGWTAVAREPLEKFAPDHVLFSYHGLPESQIRRTDASGSHCLERPDCCSEVSRGNRNCYRAQCHATSRALASALALERGSRSLAFQSRLGPSRWI